MIIVIVAVCWGTVIFYINYKTRMNGSTKNTLSTYENYVIKLDSQYNVPTEEILKTFSLVSFHFGEALDKLQSKLKHKPVCGKGIKDCNLK